MVTQNIVVHDYYMISMIMDPFGYLSTFESSIHNLVNDGKEDSNIWIRILNPESFKFEALCPIVWLCKPIFGFIYKLEAMIKVKCPSFISTQVIGVVTFKTKEFGEIKFYIVGKR
jgi:hypothetical protein